MDENDAYTGQTLRLLPRAVHIKQSCRLLLHEAHQYQEGDLCHLQLRGEDCAYGHDNFEIRKQVDLYCKANVLLRMRLLDWALQGMDVQGMDEHELAKWALTIKKEDKSRELSIFFRQDRRLKIRHVLLPVSEEGPRPQHLNRTCTMNAARKAPKSPVVDQILEMTSNHQTFIRLSIAMRSLLGVPNHQVESKLNFSICRWADCTGHISSDSLLPLSASWCYRGNIGTLFVAHRCQCTGMPS